MDNQALSERMKVVLATAHSFALKAQNYHWNVTGPHFISYHDFFKEIYEQVHQDVDVYAEQIRILGSFAPGSLTRFAELSRIACEMNIPRPIAMMKKLSEDNNIMLALLNRLHSDAELAKNVGLSSLIEDRIEYHDKLGWMLTSLSQSS
jgi:starvation-inducible DNA-binding protein